MAKAVTVPPVPVKPDVLITLSWEEARSLKRMVGAIANDETTLRFSGYVGTEQTIKTDRATVTAIWRALVGIDGLQHV